MSTNDDDHSNVHGSPMQMGLSGQFSHEDIQELLGVMGDEGEALQLPRPSTSDHPAVSFSAETDASASLNNNNDNSNIGEDDDDDDIVNTNASCISGNQPGEEAKVQARSERKRSREKQRRSDVNKQFTDLTQLLQRIDAEDAASESEALKSGASGSKALVPVAATSSRSVTFNPANRVDLIGRTICLLERLHDANKRRKLEVSSLEQQLEVASKAGEDTALKLKEAMLAPPGQPMSKQFMMMVPMMMSSDGSGTPMMNPYGMGQQPGAMPQGFCPMPQQMAAPPVASAAPASAATAMPPLSTAAPGAPASQAPTAPPVAAHHPNMMAVQHPAAAPYPYMMQAPMAAPGAGYMMPAPAMAGMHHHHLQVPQQSQHLQHSMPMVSHHQPSMQAGAQQGQYPQDGQIGGGANQEQKDSSSPELNQGSNLAHCA